MCQGWVTRLRNHSARLIHNIRGFHTVGAAGHLGEDVPHLLPLAHNLTTGKRSRVRVGTRLERVHERLDLALLAGEFLDRHCNII